MTRYAGSLVPMICNPLFEGHFQDLGIRQVDFRNIGRWWWRWILEDTFQHPDAPFERMRITAIGVHRQNRSAGQDAAPIRLEFNRNTAEMGAMHTGNAIVPCQAFVDYGVIGMDEVQDTAVALEDVLKESDRLFLHGFH